MPPTESVGEPKGFDLGACPVPHVCGEALWIDGRWGDPWTVRTLRTGASRPAPAAQPNPSAGCKKPHESAFVGSSSGSSSISSGKAGPEKPIPKPASKPYT